MIIRFDERETIFSRSGSLKPGTERYEMFYREHTEYKIFDDKRRALGGPMAIDAGLGELSRMVYLITNG